VWDSSKTEYLLCDATYGVMGILDRIREPKSPPGVAPPRDASRPGVALELLDFDDPSSASNRRNCSLFMAVMLSGPKNEVAKAASQR
jgi:hypothetical protein